ncbi:MAG TPA: TerB family tellurite resistance protein [Gemmatimonadales bacterium]|nr:TerB family tellurite resistance protein [Gemmatimonadales bacterium]
MLDAIKRFVARRIVRPESGSQPTEGPSGPSGIQVAACALLLELAHADDEFSPAERTHIESALRRHFGLDETTARELMELAEAERRQSIDHYQFARTITQQYDLGQKMVLAEVMWGVILADGEIRRHESYLVRKLANLLDLAPAYLARARRAATPPC